MRELPAPTITITEARARIARAPIWLRDVLRERQKAKGARLTKYELRQIAEHAIPYDTAQLDFGFHDVD